MITCADEFFKTAGKTTAQNPRFGCSINATTLGAMPPHIDIDRMEMVNYKNKLGNRLYDRMKDEAIFKIVGFLDYRLKERHP